MPGPGRLGIEIGIGATRLEVGRLPLQRSDVSPSEPVAVPIDELTTPNRALEPGELVYANRLLTLELVLPNVTHEINNALQVIGGLGEIMATRPGVSDDMAQKLQRIHGQAVRCSGLLRELVNYARRDDASPATDVPKGIDRALNLRRYHLARGRVAVNVEPGSTGVVSARMDSQYFEQVLVNLIINAEQATVGLPQPSIRIGYTREGDEVVVSVTDNGPGVDVDAQEELFRPFMTTREGAVGLGLTAGRVMARASGGSLRFVGPSTVELRVPVA